MRFCDMMQGKKRKTLSIIMFVNIDAKTTNVFHSTFDHLRNVTPYASESVLRKSEGHSNEYKHMSHSTSHNECQPHQPLSLQINRSSGKKNRLVSNYENGNTSEFEGEKYNITSASRKLETNMPTKGAGSSKNVEVESTEKTLASSAKREPLLVAGATKNVDEDCVICMDSIKDPKV